MRGSWLVNKNKKEGRHYASLLFFKGSPFFFLWEIFGFRHKIDEQSECVLWRKLR
jgi:hypothetical protein